MDKKSLLKDYFNFTRKERIAVISITFLLTVVFFMPFVTKKTAATVAIKEDSAWLTAVHQLKKSNDTVESENLSPAFIDRPKPEVDGQEIARTLFYFDPNTIAAGEWKRLGINEKTIRTIKNYLAKGGTFKKPEDLRKIYGFDEEQYRLLAPYIKIETPPGDEHPKLPERNSEDGIATSLVRNRPVVIDINTADTAEFISLPGIGSKLAARITSFREKLGGFYAVAQIGEIYGLQDSVFQKIKQYLQCRDGAVKKINLNTVTKEELKSHPYFRNTINAIIEYRNQHGPFASLNDLKKINAFDNETLDKMMHYLEL